MATKTYRGSCHCGAVRFEAEIDLESGTGRCNCSYCTKIRTWNALVKPEAFRLIAGEEALSSYEFGTRSGHHLFCRHCGVHPFDRGHVKELGGDFVAISIACLDNMSPGDFGALPVTYADGRNDAWWQQPTVTSYL